MIDEMFEVVTTDGDRQHVSGKYLSEVLARAVAVNTMSNLQWAGFSGTVTVYKLDSQGCRVDILPVEA
ncbi:MAG: hypothetical protein WC248_05040 [Candidatus Methanomethylophilaceae archaeon]